MKINSIALKNFRQYVDQKIEFTHLPGKKVTIIHGENHIGKTTLVKALIWCLYGDSSVYKEDPILVNRDLENGSISINQTVSVSVTIELEHNGFDYTITTKQDYIYTKGDHEQHFSPVLRDPTRYIVKMDGDGNTQPIANSEIDREIESILPRNLKNYFFYDGENNKIDDVSGTKNLKDAVRNIMGLDVREKLVQYFAPDARGKLWDRFEQDLQSDDPAEMAELQARVDEFKSKLEVEKANNLQREEDARKNRSLFEELEARIEASAEAEQLQNALVAERKNLKDLRESRERLFGALCASFDSNAGKRPGLGGVLIAMAYRDAGLGEKYANLKVTQRAYRYQTGDSVDEILKRGVCICGTHIHEGDDHYKHLVEAKEYLFPRDYSGMLDSLKQTFESKIDAAKSATESMRDAASQLKAVIGAIERAESNIKTYEDTLSGFDGDVGVWRRQANDFLQQALQSEAAVDASVKNTIPEWERQIKIYQERKEKLAKASAKNDELKRYLNYIETVYATAKDRLDKKKDGISGALQREVNRIYCEIVGSDATELELDPANYSITPFQSGKKIRLSTGQLTIKNLAFVGGLIYLAQNKDTIGGGDGELDMPDEYPLVMDAPFSSLDSENIMRACEVLPRHCSQLIITLLDKDYALAADALKPYLDKSYSLLTNSTNTNSHFVEDEQ